MAMRHVLEDTWYARWAREREARGPPAPSLVIQHAPAAFARAEHVPEHYASTRSMEIGAAYSQTYGDYIKGHTSHSKFTTITPHIGALIAKAGAADSALPGAYAAGATTPTTSRRPSLAGGAPPRGSRSGSPAPEGATELDMGEESGGETGGETADEAMPALEGTGPKRAVTGVKWTREDINTMMQLYDDGVPVSEIAGHLQSQRTEEAIKTKIRNVLKKRPAAPAEH